LTRNSPDQWIDAVYRAQDRQSLQTAYDTWASTYDVDMLSTGYLHHAVMAGLVCRHAPRKDAAILDAGVGTGALGSLLNVLGYNNLSGLDLSEGMLAIAASRKCYADLRQATLGERLDFVDESFDAIISAGTFTEGHAPASAFDELVRILETDGVLMFTISTLVWDDKGFKTKLETLTRSGRLKLMETTPPYQPMPHSKTESHVTTRGYVYRKVG
jgi:ubiquinone/menaquinone biosynthesis C-methylase UbiE